MSIDHADVPDVLVVEQWHRFSHHRAYVRSGARKLGHRDLVTGDVTCDLPQDIDRVAQATADIYRRFQAKRYRAQHARDEESPAAARPTTMTQTAAGPSSPERESTQGSAALAPQTAPSGQPILRLCDQDLALNVPGQAARAQAAALREAAPIHTFVARALGARTEERSWRIGADGEVEIARRLERLPAAWRRLFAIPVGGNGSDIDALVVGPGGVFSINAKKHPDAKVWVRGDTVKINGTNKWYVRNSRHEATRSARLLSAAAKFDVEVHGVVAVTGHRGFRVKAQPIDGLVIVLEAGGLAAHLLAQPTVLGDPSISRIYDVARHLATWQPNTVQWAEFEG